MQPGPTSPKARMNTRTLYSTHDCSTDGHARIDPQTLRAALGRFVTGVTVVTACAADGRLTGVTANSFNSVSLDPPLVLWSLSRKAGSLPIFEQATHWAVHILAHGQAALSDRFARQGSDKFAGLEFRHGESNTPLLAGCSARFLCRSRHFYDGGDHVILVGEVVDFEHNDQPALVYNNSGYAIATGTQATGTGVENATASQAVQRQADQNLGFLIGSAFYHMFAELRDAAGSLGFSNTETFVLQALDQRGWRTRKEIDALLRYAGHPADHVIDDLEARNLLTARECAAGGQDTEFDLTEKGRGIAQQMNTAALEIANRMDQILGLSGSIALRALLTRFVRDTAAQRPVTWL